MYGTVERKRPAKGANFTYNPEILERTRMERGLSYTDIAKQLGINKVTVARTLKGISMRPRTVKLLADYLGIEMGRVVRVFQH